MAIGRVNLSKAATLITLSLSAQIAAPAADNIVRHVELETPRPFGHVIGDTIRHEITLKLDASYHLDQASLPEAGRLNSWLELRPPMVRIDKSWGARTYEITLTYQIFNIADGPRSVVTPGFALSAAGPERTVPVVIPEWAFTVRPITPRPEGDLFLALRPDRAPALIALDSRIQRITWLSVGVLLTALLLIHAYWGLPLLARSRRPFTRTYRRLKRLQRKPVDQAHRREALRQMHEAFNHTAERALFSDDLDRFFRQKPQFAALRAPIEAFFSMSRRDFFASDDATRHHASLDDVTALCRQCREVERGIP